jgi:hypothetical protein
MSYSCRGPPQFRVKNAFSLSRPPQKIVTASESNAIIQSNRQPDQVCRLRKKATLTKKCDAPKATIISSSLKRGEQRPECGIRAGTGTSASRNLYAEAAIRVRVVQSAPTIVCARGRPYCRCSDVVPLLDDRGFEEVIFLLNIHCLRHRDCRACTSSGKHSRPEIGDEAVEIWKMPSPALFAADSPYQRGVEGIFHAASPWRVFLDFWTMNPLSPKKKTPRCCNANFIAATGADTRDSRRASKSLTLAIGTSDNVASPSIVNFSQARAERHCSGDIWIRSLKSGLQRPTIFPTALKPGQPA